MMFSWILFSAVLAILTSTDKKYYDAVKFCHPYMLDYAMASTTRGPSMTSEKFQPTATIAKLLHVAYLWEPVGV
jgi:hypothetical protein